MVFNLPVEQAVPTTDPKIVVPPVTLNDIAGVLAEIDFTWKYIK